MILRRAVLLLGLTLSILPGCGRTFIYERADPGDPSAFVLTGKRFTYLPISNSYRAQQEVKLLPAGQFPEARNWALGCWRFKTSDGFETEAMKSALVDYFDERLIVTDPMAERTVERIKIAYAVFRELVSRDTFEIETDEGILQAKQVFREGRELRIIGPRGGEHRVRGNTARFWPPSKTPSYKEPPPGREGLYYSGCVKNRERPYKPAPIYAINGKGLALRFPARLRRGLP